MTLPHDDIDPGGLLEYSVVFTDLSLNHMSRRFVGVMQELLGILRETYRAAEAAIVPGGGTYAMESVARQFATDRRVLVVRNGLFSYRWSQIFEAGAITSDVIVCRARPLSDGPHAPWAPAPIEDVVDRVRAERPEVVFAPHVETAAGIVLTDDYVRTLAAATHEVGGLFVLDCVASGALWVDMDDLGVDVLLTAPQKGWSGSPGAGYVMLSEAGAEAVRSTRSTSFAADLGRWLSIAAAYTHDQSPYHATMPTDTLAHNLELMRRTVAAGLPELRQAQLDLGAGVRTLLADRGFDSVAAPDVASASVVVSYTDDPAVRSGARLKEAGVQVAAGVPLQCGEGEDFSTFRMGLFGLDKLADPGAAVDRLAAAFDRAGI